MTSHDRGLTSSELFLIEPSLTRTTYPAFLFKIDLSSSTLHLTTHIHDLTYDGDTYTATPDIISFNPARETKEVRSEGASFTLSGIPSQNIDFALRDDYKNRSFDAWLAFIDQSTHAISEAFSIFSGLMDQMIISKGAEESSIEFKLESKLATLRNRNFRRYTHEDQQQFVDSNDTGLSYIADLQERPIIFGGRKASLDDRRVFGGGNVFGSSNTASLE